MQNILVIDVGGTNVKIYLNGKAPVRFPSGKLLTPLNMITGTRELTADWEYDVISIGYPGPVVRGKIMLEPVNLGPGWVDYNFEKNFGKPVKLINDAAMQALGSFEGGTMLFLGLGTGLGTAMVADGLVLPMEVGHLPYRKNRSFEDYLGVAGQKRQGRRKWEKSVHDVVARLKAAFVADYVVLGGGNVKKLEEIPPGARAGDNFNAVLGGLRLWDMNAKMDLLPEAPH
jgi:predicted NBD/HSP70 family sugar kinase